MSSFLQRIKQQAKGNTVTTERPKQNNIDADISSWLNKPDPGSTQRILKQIKPAIQSALHTYVPGQQNQYRVKATRFALDSLRGYDPKKKVAPSTYVFTQLRRLSRIKRQRDNIVHIPESQVYAKIQLDKAMQSFRDRYDRDPSDQQLADAMHISKKKLTKLMDSVSGRITNDSANVNAVTGQSNFSVSNVTDDDYFDYVYRSVSPQDQLIMQYTAGKGKPMLSNNQIAQKLKLSPGAVSQRKAKINQMLSEVRGLL